MDFAPLHTYRIRRSESLNFYCITSRVDLNQIATCNSSVVGCVEIHSNRLFVAVALFWQFIIVCADRHVGLYQKHYHNVHVLS